MLHASSMKRSILAAIVLLAACNSPVGGALVVDPVPEAVPCSSSTLAIATDAVATPRVFVDDTLPEQVRADLRSYLGRLWGTPIEVVVGTPSGTAVWISSSADAKARARGTDTGYSIVRTDQTIIVHSGDPKDLVAGAYALLEELGVRFFHPMQEFVPELGAPQFPRALDIHRAAAFVSRGIQFHTLHPLEYLDTLNAPGPQSLDEAKRVVDWLVKTGQNYLQWPLLGEGVPWEPFREHVRQIMAYAHARGVTVGCAVQLHLKAALQRNYVLVRKDETWEADIVAGVTRLMELPWDDVDIAMGEFLTTDPERLLLYIEKTRTDIQTISPSTRVSVHNHCGNYPELWIDFRGVPNTYFYHVPKYADPKLGQTVHSLFFYDLYREGGMYEHPNFHWQREFIFEQLRTHGTNRRVRYYPEQAYWIAADIDVPIFLPEFIESRWIDIHNLHRDTRAQGLPPLDGHILFSSGHEWGYWMTDYLVAKMMWEPEAPLERFLTHYTSAYGSCSADIGTAFSQFVSLERQYLFEKKLIPYLSGEDNAVDLGGLLGYTIRPLRKKFDDLVTESEQERVAFETGTLAELQAFTAAVRPIERDVDARCRGSDPILAPWCNELRDGIRITRKRLEHTILLYQSVLAYGRGDIPGAHGLLEKAVAKTAEAAITVGEREKSYRFDLERLTGAYVNPTNYHFGYLRQAHTQCLWRRQDEQARRIIDEGILGGLVSGLSSCLN